MKQSSCEIMDKYFSFDKKMEPLPTFLWLFPDWAKLLLSPSPPPPLPSYSLQALPILFTRFNNQSKVCCQIIWPSTIRGLVHFSSTHNAVFSVIHLMTFQLLRCSQARSCITPSWRISYQHYNFLYASFHDILNFLHSEETPTSTRWKF